MKAKKTHYLVDFENVGEGGITLSGPLGGSDFVYLFSTKTSAKISTMTLASFNLSNLQINEVPAGSQSVDKHLLAYLGYLLGTDGAKASYVIVSKDTGYDSIMAYWKQKLGVDIVRQTAIQNPQTKPAKKAAPAKKTKAIMNAADLAQRKMVFNANLMQALKTSPYDNNTRGKAASLASKHFNDTNRDQTIRDGLTKKFGQKVGLDIYEQIKHLL